MHWYKFNIADYRKDTGHLTMLEHGIYRTLLDWAYLDEKPIPKEIQSVMRRLGLGSDQQKSLENVLADFFVLRVDGYHQLRCSYEISSYKENAIKNIANGKLGGRPKKTHPVNLGNPNESGTKGNQEPVTNNQEPLVVPKGTCPTSRTPSQQLLEIFHSKCTLLPKVSVFNDNRRKTLQARYREVMSAEKWSPDETMNWFGVFYEKVNSSKFLTGRAPPSRDGRIFRADWDWIHGPQNFVKVCEGKYDGG